MSTKKRKSNTLSEKLSSLIQTKPCNIDSDDGEDITTVEKITSQNNESDYSADELDLTKYRKVNTGLLADDDDKYLGKGVSRKDLSYFSDDSSDNASDDSGDALGSAVKAGTGTDSEVDDSQEDDDELDEEEEDEEEEGDESENDTGSPSSSNKVEPEEKFSGINDKNILGITVSDDLEKGKAIKSQLHLWDFLLECRMKFQPCLVSSNQCPLFKTVNKFKQNSEYNDCVTHTKKSLKHLLKSLLSLQEVLLQSNKDFVNTLGGDKDSKNDSEEIDSDFEDVEDEESKNEETKNKLFNSNIKKLSDFSKEINRRHKTFESYRNSTIQKWNDKTRIGFVSSKNFSAFEQSTLKQIEQVLLDKSRLISRTQIKRSSYHILGQRDGDEGDEPKSKKQALEDGESPDAVVTPKRNVTNREIFDDDDFYHQLLSELLKRKASDITDPVQLGRQWMQLQQIRSKMKKIVDTKASKGRKVRFVVHPKLVNFMMPTLTGNEYDDSRAELINSLFGRKK